MENILVAIDGSETSLHALKKAREIAQMMNCQLLVCYVVDGPADASEAVLKETEMPVLVVK